MRRLLVGSLCLLFAAVAAAQDSPPKRVLTIDDYFKIKGVQSPRLSPDGAWVAYTVTEADLDEEKTETRLWMAPIEGGAALPMTAEGASAGTPRWSPDGKYLSFLAARDGGKTQVWALDRRGGEARALTDVEQGVSGYTWSPDGGRLLLEIKDPEPEEAGEDGEEERAPRPWVINRLQFKRDYAGYLDERRTHLYVFDLTTDSLTQITSGPFDDGQAVWSPDGRRVAFVSNRTDEPDGNGNTDIWIAAADNTDQGATLLRVTQNPGSDSSPAWSPDGSMLAYVTVTEPDLIWYATNHLAVVQADGSGHRVLTSGLDRNVSDPAFTPDGASVVFLLEDSAERHLARIDLADRRVRRTVDGPRSVRGYHMNAGGAIALLISEPGLPGEVFASSGAQLRKLTSVNDELIAGLKLAAVENVRFPSADGTEIEGFIYLPPGYEAGLRYPTLLRIHGGPVSQYDFRFNFEAQLFAANGYVVVMVNPRGSSGYGQAFSQAIWQDWGNKDYQDVMAGVDYAVAQGYADADRLGVGGWSYGGILTNYVITKTDRFEAAITGASEVLYVANYGHDHYQYQWEKELGLPWESRDAWERISPFNAVEKIVTPTLIMGGEKDWNVPILNSEQLYQALRRLGRTTQLVVYPGEHHGIRRLSFQKDRFERYLAWYDKYVKGH